MATWILDDGPLGDLSLFVSPEAAAAWPRGELLVADATARAATGRRKALLEHPSSPFATFSVMVGSAAFDLLYSHLRDPAASDENLAEHQSIAWALTECPDAILVTKDKGAAFLALAELGRGGAAHPTELWLELQRRRLIERHQFEQLCDRTRKSDQSKVPHRCR